MTRKNGECTLIQNGLIVRAQVMCWMYSMHRVPSCTCFMTVHSPFYSLMISLSAAAVTVSYRTPMDAYNASPTDPGLSIRVYQWVSVLSVSYFMLDALLIAIYYNQSVAKKASFAVHHCAVAVGLSCILVTHPFMAYVSAMWLLTELSTVVLNVCSIYCDFNLFPECSQNVLGMFSESDRNCLFAFWLDLLSIFSVLCFQTVPGMWSEHHFVAFWRSGSLLEFGRLSGCIWWQESEWLSAIL